MHRLFVALRPPPAIRAQLAALMGGVPGARWQDDEQLHLTLRFIGEVERPLAEDVVAALGQVHAPAIAVSLSGVGQFVKRGRADALWAGVAPHDALAALHRKIDAALVRIGLPPEFAGVAPGTPLEVSVALDPGALPGALRLPALFEPAWQLSSPGTQWLAGAP